jgi:hypothetical protein
MKRTLLFHTEDGGWNFPITSVSVLPDSFSRSFSLQEKKDGTFHMCHSESFIKDFSTVKNIEIIRE